MRIKVIVFYIILSLFMPSAYSHPGRLDGKGGHKVWKDYSYKSGFKVMKGSYHYHTMTNESTLGDIHLLEDEFEKSKTITPDIKSSHIRIGSNEEDVYHKKSCSYLQNMDEKNVVIFKDITDAKRNFYRPCKRCSKEDIQ